MVAFNNPYTTPILSLIGWQVDQILLNYPEFCSLCCFIVNKMENKTTVAFLDPLTTPILSMIGWQVDQLTVLPWNRCVSAWLTCAVT
jgi:hypothetical protein